MFRSSSLAVVILLLVSVLGGCDSASRNGASSIEGVVAVGAPVEADVTVLDITGKEVTGRSNAAGEYVLNTTGFTAPFMIRAITDDGRIMYSYAERNYPVTNVTPLTSYVVDRVALVNDLFGGAGHLYYSFSANSRVNDDVTAQLTLLSTILSSMMESAGLGEFDHFRDAFDADHTGYDAFLDVLDVEIDGDDVVIRVDNSLFHTLSYDIVEGTLEVSGQVVNANTNASMDNATLLFTNDYSGDVTVTTGIDGRYTAMLDNFRRYDITVSAANFYPVLYKSVSTFSLTPVSTQLIPMIPTDIVGDGTISGTVSNARTGGGLAGVSLQLRAGVNNLDGEVAANTSVNADGAYTLSVATGVYTAEYSLDGFTTAYATVVSLAGQVYTQNASLVTAVNNDGAFATVVLSWDADPSDLDTFLTGPSSVLNDRFKLAFYQKIFTTAGNYDSSSLIGFNRANPCATSEVVASIDLDDVASYGPETTTICQVEEGEYRYYVHHYSGASSITDSPAQVVVTTAYGITRMFTAPQGATGTSSDVWHVFNLDGYGNITPVNNYLADGTNGVLSQPSGESVSDAGLIDYLPAK